MVTTGFSGYLEIDQACFSSFPSVFTVREKEETRFRIPLLERKWGGLYPFDPTLSLVTEVSVYKAGVVWTREGGRGEGEGGRGREVSF